jgi:hypothetical protein
MNSGGSHWRGYWVQKDSAEHRHDTLKWREFYARELLLYFPKQPARALELGCGNGDLYGTLRAHLSSYVGIDYSPAMLRKFRSTWPDTPLVCADASRIPLRGGRYDIVFSNGVCQYLDREMLRANLKQVCELLDDSGIYVIGNIPDAHLHALYCAGGLRGDRNISWPTLARVLVASVVKRNRRGKDGIGEWYPRRFVSKLASEHGFTCRTFSSASYEYRFHAVLKKGMHGGGAGWDF